ncbi:hypothetical protein K435DRAFT_799944 [Dendrothele bispora CBS 962.96]|uniref:Uncharacterized protein n=1 Tax=Dendrothele bispora (strain CBS 962.96) TaxID=1314807 RepID=A0A4S8LVJ4_DENBC|nr:hypothetical protein K435DRAFT_799944 [Dendrothele bispora CBS 962.96]
MTYVCPIQVGKWSKYEGDPCCLYLHIIDIHQDFGKMLYAEPEGAGYTYNSDFLQVISSFAPAGEQSMILGSVSACQAQGTLNKNEPSTVAAAHQPGLGQRSTLLHPQLGSKPSISISISTSTTLKMASTPSFFVNPYNPALDDRSKSSYNWRPYRDLKESDWTYEVVIPDQLFVDSRTADTITEDLGSLLLDINFSCTYHLVTNQDPNAAHSVFQCCGPLGGTQSHYYQVFRTSMHHRTQVCWKCWTPTALEELQHPTVIPGTICRGRENFEDLYRAVPYLVWQIRALRKPVFKLLGLKRYVDCFTSTIDWCHWLAHPATETLPDLTNLVSSFAYAYLYSLGRLPSDSLEIDRLGALIRKNTFKPWPKGIFPD